MQLEKNVLLFLAFLNLAYSYASPNGQPSCPGGSYCLDSYGNTKINNMATIVTSNATGIATTLQTMSVYNVTTSPTYSFQQPPPDPTPEYNSNPYFSDPNLIWIKFCNGQAAPDNAGCTGNCTVWTGDCKDDDPLRRIRHNQWGCEIHAHNTDCIETNGKVYFRACSFDLFGKDSDPKTDLTCTYMCQYHPGVTEEGRWIYNARWTDFIQVHPNPERLWGKDYNGEKCG